jgi:hypothetical protein
MFDLISTERIATAANWHQTRKSVWCMHGQIPCAIATHAKPSDVDPVEIDPKTLDKLIQQSR